jgi:dihydroorotate dehydrogenase
MTRSRKPKDSVRKPGPGLAALSDKSSTDADADPVVYGDDLDDADIDAVADLCLELGLDGVIAVNTTVTRAGLRSADAEIRRAGDGGLSGAPLKARALQVLRRLRARDDRLVLVSVGGVSNADDVWERLEAGASLVQLYTALIYDGPGLVRLINKGLVEHLRSSGHRALSELRSDVLAERPRTPQK